MIESILATFHAVSWLVQLSVVSFSEMFDLSIKQSSLISQEWSVGVMVLGSNQSKGEGKKRVRGGWR